MFDSLTNSIVAGTLFGILTIVDIYCTKKIKHIFIFFKFLLFGIVALFLYILFSKQIKNDPIWETNRNGIILLFIILGIVLLLAHYFMYSAHEQKDSVSHIIIPIMFTISMFISIVGTSILFNEKMKPMAFLGIAFMLIGLLIVKKCSSAAKTKN